MAIPKIQDYSIDEIMPSVADNVAGWTLDKSRAALLIHDMQNYFIDFYQRDSELVSLLVKNIQMIKTWCKEHSIPVIYTAQPPKQRPEDRALLTDFWGPGLQSSGELVDIVSSIAPSADDTQLTKWRYSAFQRTPLHQLLHEDKRDQLVIVGVYAHIGILASALEAFMTDIQPFVVADAVADFDRESHLAAMTYIAKRCGQVFDTASLVGSNSVSNEQVNFTADVTEILRLNDAVNLDEDLFDLGLDSIRLMALLERWQQRGVSLTFQDVAQCNTLRMIQDVAERKRGEAAVVTEAL